MHSIRRTPCKDCRKEYLYSQAAEARDLAAGRSPPERCGACRALHSREIRTLAVSHSSIARVSAAGSGGVTAFSRPDRAPTEIRVERQTPPPLPMEEIIGSPTQAGSLLHNLVRREKQVCVVVGPTGSGKSTWLPLRLLECDELVRDGPICVTQPRIPAAEEIPSYVSILHYGGKNVGGVLKPLVEPGPGCDIGYRHSGVGRDRSDSANRLIYMTDGVLLNEVVSGDVRRYSVVMIDEAHERSVNIDLILNLLRQRLPLYPMLRLVIASATVDAKRFADFFGGEDYVWMRESKGFTHPILEIWGDETVASYGPPVSWNDVRERAMEIAPTLTYHAQFEALVNRGPLEEAPAASLRALREGDAAWTAALDVLLKPPTIPLLDPARHITQADWVEGEDPPWAVERQGVKVLLDAVVAKVLWLVERDENERLCRRARWRTRVVDAPSLPEPRVRGDILVFLPTSKTIDDVVDRLRSELTDGNNEVFPFYRDLLQDEKDRARDAGAVSPEVRRIIVATNLAETSLTTRGLVYVVESGIILQSFWDSRVQDKEMLTILHSKAGCRQRAGRVGRTEPGEVHRLYTRGQLQRYHRDFTIPEMQRSCAESTVLRLSAAGVGDLAGFKWLDQPAVSELQRAIDVMKRSGAIDEDGDVTPHGVELLQLPLDRPFLGHVLIEAERHCCLFEAATMLAFSQLRMRRGIWAAYVGDDDEPEVEPTILDVSRSGAPALQEIRRQLEVGHRDDAELYLHIWDAWESTASGVRDAWARMIGVSVEAMQSIEKDRHRLLEPFQDERKGARSRRVSPGRVDALRSVLARVLPTQVFTWHGGSWTSDGAGEEVLVHPDSVLHGDKRAGVDAIFGVNVRRCARSALAWCSTERSGNVLVASHVLAVAAAGRSAAGRDSTSLAMQARAHSGEIAASAPFELGGFPALELQAKLDGEAEAGVFREAHGWPQVAVTTTVEAVRVDRRGRLVADVVDPTTGTKFSIPDPTAQADSYADQIAFLELHAFTGSYVDFRPVRRDNRWAVIRHFDRLPRHFRGLVVESDRDTARVWLGFCQGRIRCRSVRPGALVDVVVAAQRPDGSLDLDVAIDPWLTAATECPIFKPFVARVVFVRAAGVFLAVGPLLAKAPTRSLPEGCTPQAGDLVNVVVESYRRDSGEIRVRVLGGADDERVASIDRPHVDPSGLRPGAPGAGHARSSEGDRGASPSGSPEASTDPTEPDALLAVRLSAGERFRRVYHRSVRLSRNELRGAAPLGDLAPLAGTGLHVVFGRSQVKILRPTGATSCRLDDEEVREGVAVTLPMGRSKLAIGKVTLFIAVEDMGARAAGEMA